MAEARALGGLEALGRRRGPRPADPLVAETDASAAAIAGYRSDEYGVSTVITGSSSQPFGFTGEPRDATGLSYLRARYYDPSLGRFMSRDPWAGQANDPTSLNRCIYATDNPLTLSDPAGRSSSAKALNHRCSRAQVGAAALVVFGTGTLTMLQTYLLLGIPASGGLGTPGVAVALGFIEGVELLVLGVAGVIYFSNC